MPRRGYQTTGRAGGQAVWLWNVFSSDWDECIGACLCGWEEGVISFRTDKDYFSMEPVSIVSVGRQVHRGRACVVS